MRWLWQRRKKAEPDEAQRHIDRLERQQPEVTRLTRELGEARRRNHFAELIAAAMRGA